MNSGLGGWSNAPRYTVPYCKIQDQKAATSDGGTFTAGAWQTRVLNTKTTDPAGIASLASNQITLQAGTYWVHWSCPAFRVSTHATRLQNVTDGVTILRGTNGYSAATATGDSRSDGADKFTISTPKVLELQHYCQTTQATTGLGVGSASFALDGSPDVYSYIEFRKEG